MKNRGFTLVEILVVLLLMGILAAIAIPQYSKTLENAAAQDAQVSSQAIASAVRMTVMDRLTVKNNSMVAPNLEAASGDGVSSVMTAGHLVAKGYLINMSYSKKYYFYVCNGTAAGSPCCAAGYYACAKRISGDYAAWTYRITTSGQCVATGSEDMPACQ
ncbi:MAG: prepilin-type N-terminal cleavage/methylation domain-containing protein [Elusimicrobiaceae bacterium]|nr:prepilin-type N-terminal cleavage/methylation domain-containing protein [Elusimicrobiaceae bacterium]